MNKYIFLILSLAISHYSLISQTITNLTVAQRTDGSGLDDIYFTLSGTANAYYISAEASFNGGNTFTPIPAGFLTGDTGPISPGTGKHIIWNGLQSFPNTYSTQALVKLTATIIPLSLFSDDFLAGNYSQWNFYKYTSGLHGQVPDPYVTNGRLNIITRDQQATFLSAGETSWTDYTFELDAKVEASLDDGYKGIYCYFYVNNLHYAPNNQISCDAYHLNLKGRNQTWSLWRIFQNESGTSSFKLVEGSLTLGVGVDYHIKIICQGNLISIWYNQVGSSLSLLGQVTVNQNSLLGGGIGIGGSDDRISIDNIIVYEN